MPKHILALDSGTTGTIALVFDKRLRVLGRSTRPMPLSYPRPGWVSQDPEDIWDAAQSAMRGALKSAGVSGSSIAAIGITNQRETTILWNRRTSRSVAPAIVWQCRRTSDLCDKLKAQKLEPLFKRRTGLVLDPYFSGTKIRWLLDNVAGLREKSRRGQIAFGTVDSWLMWKLTRGRSHVTDVSNASRTLLMNLRTLKWDPELLKLLKIPKALLPKICDSSKVLDHTSDVPGLPDGIPIAALIGDQQSALFGQGCFEPGSAKCTYGTGAFLVAPTGGRPVRSRNGLLSTVAWKIGSQTTYALEGSVFVAGAAVQWLRDGLKLIRSSAEVEALAKTVPDNGGVVFVPALTGLGAPHWKSEARGLISGLTRGVGAGHIARATLEAISFQIHDLVRAMESDLGKRFQSLRVDGGASANNLLMQLQSDILGIRIDRPAILETTALGAAALAGVAVGFWKKPNSISKLLRMSRSFTPRSTPSARRKKLQIWKTAIQKA